MPENALTNINIAIEPPKKPNYGLKHVMMYVEHRKSSKIKQ